MLRLTGIAVLVINPVIVLIWLTALAIIESFFQNKFLTSISPQSKTSFVTHPRGRASTLHYFRTTITIESRYFSADSELNTRDKLSRKGQSQLDSRTNRRQLKNLLETARSSIRSVTCEIMDIKIEDFKLSTELSGHSLDVRSVVTANNCIVSGSRDKTSKIWEQSDGWVNR